MLARVFLLLVLVPTIEVVVLVWIATQTSWWFVLGLLLATGILGTWLARLQGWRTMSRLTSQMQAGQMPAEALFDGFLVFVAAILLIVPGFLTDVVALVLLFPPTRHLLKQLLRRRVQAHVVTHYAPFVGSGFREEIIDVKVTESPPRELPGA